MVHIPSPDSGTLGSPSLSVAGRGGKGWRGMSSAGVRHGRDWAPVGTAGSRPASHTLVLSCDFGARPRGPVAPSLAALPAAGPVPAPSGAGAEGGHVPLQLLLWLLSGTLPFHTADVPVHLCLQKFRSLLGGRGDRAKRKWLTLQVLGPCNTPRSGHPVG